MFAGNLLVAAEDDFLESLLEVVIEGDVDHRVDHGVAVGEHVEPEPVLLDQAGQLNDVRKLFYLELSYYVGEVTFSFCGAISDNSILQRKKTCCCENRRQRCRDSIQFWFLAVLDPDL